MNKYQKALKVLYENIDCNNNMYLDNLIGENLEIISELVDKTTPKKFKIKTDKDGRTIWVCSNCGDVLMKFWSDVETISPRKYCDECGQRLDWSDK